MMRAGARLRAAPSSDFLQFRFRDIVAVRVAVLDLPVPQLPDDLEDLRPRRVHLAIDLLVGLDRHHEFELLGVHLALFSAASFIRAPAAWAASAFKTGVVATFNAGATLGTVIPGLRRG